ncbi:MAG: hypothetical protein ACYCO4_01175 [Sulfobacillus sp.]
MNPVKRLEPTELEKEPEERDDGPKGPKDERREGHDGPEQRNGEITFDGPKEHAKVSKD